MISRKNVYAFHCYPMLHLNNIKNAFACMQLTIVMPNDKHASDNPDFGHVQVY
jgi:hypothetical protein